LAKLKVLNLTFLDKVSPLDAFPDFLFVAKGRLRREGSVEVGSKVLKTKGVFFAQVKEFCPSTE
jgi:hypothetical protein